MWMYEEEMEEDRYATEQEQEARHRGDEVEWMDGEGEWREGVMDRTPEGEIGIRWLEEKEAEWEWKYATRAAKVRNNANGFTKMALDWGA